MQIKQHTQTKGHPINTHLWLSLWGKVVKEKRNTLIF